jgi:hypothetical protein
LFIRLKEDSALLEGRSFLDNKNNATHPIAMLYSDKVSSTSEIHNYVISGNESNSDIATSSTSNAKLFCSPGSLVKEVLKLNLSHYLH